MLIGVDNLNKKFKQFAKDFKDQNESIRIQEARDRAMNTEAVKEALANQAERQAYYTTQFMKEGMKDVMGRKPTKGCEYKNVARRISPNNMRSIFCLSY